MNRTSSAATLLATVTLWGGLTVGTQAASGPTLCQGNVSHQRISGDVLVKPGTSCALDDVVVRGNITVQEGATLKLKDSTVKGDVRGAYSQQPTWETPGSTFEITHSHITGTTLVQGKGHFQISGSRLGRFETQNYAKSGADGTVTSSTLDSIELRGSLELMDSVVRGNFTSPYSTGLSMDHSTVHGITSSSAVGQIKVCGSQFRQNTELGTTSSLVMGDKESCSGNRFRKDLNITNVIFLSAYNNAISGHTTSPAGEGMGGREGTNNRFKGGVEGVMAKLA